MVRKAACLAPALALLALIGLGANYIQAQKKVDHPRLRAALHELREARRVLQDARDAWPPGYKERALASTQEAIRSLMLILAVKDVNTFRGIDRDPDYYKQYKDHPRLRAALHDLREAREELRHAKADFGNLRQRALDDIDQAIGDVLTLIRFQKR